MADQDLYPIPADWAARARVHTAGYEKLHGRSLADPGSFWLDQAKRLDWIKRPEIAGDWSFDAADFHINWFADGKLNVSANCIDRHLAKRGDQIALIWEPDAPQEDPRRFTYRQLHAEVCRFANVLKAQGVAKGDRVTIYLPMIPEAAFAVLACARIGAIHSVVFGGFSAEALAGRITDCDSTIVVTADEGRRGGKTIPLKTAVDAAARHAPGLRRVIVVKATGGAVDMQPGRDVWYHDTAAEVSAECAPEAMGAEDPLFILYTSGSTGKPKGVLHSSAGYLLWASLTHELRASTITPRRRLLVHGGRRVGDGAQLHRLWAAFANGATTLMFEGRSELSRRVSRFWEVIDKHKVHTIFYTAPTAIRALMKRWRRRRSKKTSRASLQTAGLGGRADQSGSVALVSRALSVDRPLPDRGYVVADGDGRDRDDYAAAWCDRR